MTRDYISVGFCRGSCENSNGMVDRANCVGNWAMALYRLYESLPCGCFFVFESSRLSYLISNHNSIEILLDRESESRRDCSQYRGYKIGSPYIKPVSMNHLVQARAESPHPRQHFAIYFEKIPHYKRDPEHLYPTPAPAVILPNRESKAIGSMPYLYFRFRARQKEQKALLNM